MRIGLVFTLFGAGLLRVALGTSDESLSLGDPAPTLDPVDWIAGDPILAWDPGRVYVLAFWATWSQPSIAAMPTVASLRQFEERGVEVVAVAVAPRPGQISPEEFVKTRGDLDLRIASDRGGAIGRGFLAATGRGGLPVVMIVGKTGALEWIGHPLEGVEEVVVALVEDRYDQ